MNADGKTGLQAAIDDYIFNAYARMMPHRENHRALGISSVDLRAIWYESAKKHHVNRDAAKYHDLLKKHFFEHKLIFPQPGATKAYIPKEPAFSRWLDSYLSAIAASLGTAIGDVQDRIDPLRQIATSAGGEPHRRAQALLFAKWILDHQSLPDMHNGGFRFKEAKNGLLYVSGSSLPNPSREFRSILLRGLQAVDIANCVPTILLNLCLKHNIGCPSIAAYVADREKIIARLCTDIEADYATFRPNVKEFFLSIIYGGKGKGAIADDEKRAILWSDAFVKSFAAEVESAGERLIELHRIRGGKIRTPTGYTIAKGEKYSLLSHILQAQIRVFQQEAKDRLRRKLKLIAVDCIFFEGDDEDVKIISDRVTKRIGFSFRFSRSVIQ